LHDDENYKGVRIEKLKTNRTNLVLLSADDPATTNLRPSSEKVEVTDNL
jgi:hypothetical protein